MTNKLICAQGTLLQLLRSDKSKANFDVLATCHFAQRDQILASYDVSVQHYGALCMVGCSEFMY